ncbi:MAG: hypothetical protein Q8M94_06265 [Ignavibacteria bacterium]|nr:hypothetical protein [Ignavibacteria bacterium]
MSDNTFSKIFSDAFDDIKQEEENLLKKIIGELTIAEIIRRGRFEVYPDGSKIFIWDCKPRIEFLPIVFTNEEDGRVTMTLSYRLIGETGDMTNQLKGEIRCQKESV